MAAAEPKLRRASALRALASPALAAVAVAVAAMGCDAEPRDLSRPPAGPRTTVPADTQRYIHETFHRLPRSCNRRRADRTVLDAMPGRFIRLYRRYPAERFRMTIDDESGTMLSAMLVLRNELATCSPRHAALIDPVLPPSVRRALRPLPTRRG